MKKFKTENYAIFMVISLIVLFILMFLMGPLFVLIREGFFVSAPKLSVYITEIIQSDPIIQSLKNTLLMACLTVFTVNILGIFELLVTKIYKIKYSKIFEALFSIALVSNGIIMVMGYLFLFGGNGVVNVFLFNIFPSFNINWFQGWIPILLVHTFSFTIFYLLFVGDAIGMIDNSIVDSAINLGANRRQIFFKIILPIIKPTLITSSIFVFLFSVGSNAAPTFLGGKLFPMINPTIRDLNSIGDNKTAIILSVILGIITFIAYMLMIYQQRKRRLFIQSKASEPFKKMEIKSKNVKNIFTIFAIFISFLYILPLITSLTFSFTSISTIYLKRWDGILTLDNYIRVFNDLSILSPILNSIILSLSASFVALIFGISVVLLNKQYQNVLTKLLENVFALVWMIPSIVMAIGISIMYSEIPFNFEFDKSLLLPCAYILTIVYIVIYNIKSALRNVNFDMLESAQSLSSGKLNIVFKIILPILKPSIISSGIICFNILLTEYTISEILYTYKNIPISVLFKSELSNPSSYQMANILIYTTIIIIISLALFIIQANLKNVNKKYSLL
jgi:iron(III) transport system permease protein